MGGDAAEIALLIEVKKRGTEVFDDIRDQLSRLELQAVRTNLILASTAAVTSAAANAMASSNAAAGVGIPLWLALAIAITAVALALSPFLALIGSAVVILTAFTVGAAGFLTVGALVAGTLAAIGAGILFLGGGGGVGAAAALDKATAALQNANEALAEWDALHQGALTLAQQFDREQLVENIAKAQDAYNQALLRSQGPMGVLLAQLGAVRDAWAQQAAPLAAVITQWTGAAIPAIQLMGSTIIDWFGQRIPTILTMAGIFFQLLGQILQPLGVFFGQFADQVGQRWAGFSIILAQFVAAVLIPAIQGLMTNLLALSDWFTSRLPTYGPVVQQIFGGIGAAVQGVATIWGKFSDWLVANWPNVTAWVAQAIQNVTDTWNKLSPQLNLFVSQLWPRVSDAIIDIGKHMDVWLPQIVAIIAAMAILATIIIQVADWIVKLMAVLDQIGITMSNFSNNIRTNVWNALQGVWQWFVNIIGAIETTITKLGQIHWPTGGHSGNLLGFAEGGTVPGPTGAPLLAVVHGGETVIPAGRGGGGGPTIVNHIHINPAFLDRSSLDGMMAIINRELGREIRMHTSTHR
jgi:hypothetical protein